MKSHDWVTIKLETDWRRTETVIVVVVVVVVANMLDGNKSDIKQKYITKGRETRDLCGCAVA